MSFLLTGALLATGVLLGRLLGRGMAKKDVPAPAPNRKDDASQPAAQKPADAAGGAPHVRKYMLIPRSGFSH